MAVAVLVGVFVLVDVAVGVLVGVFVSVGGIMIGVMVTTVEVGSWVMVGRYGTQIWSPAKILFGFTRQFAACSSQTVKS